MPDLQPKPPRRARPALRRTSKGAVGALVHFSLILVAWPAPDEIPRLSITLVHREEKVTWDSTSFSFSPVLPVYPPPLSSGVLSLWLFQYFTTQACLAGFEFGYRVVKEVFCQGLGLCWISLSTLSHHCCR